MILSVWLAAGCDDRPRAPALVTEAVFHDPAVGVRFAVPDGWEISGRTLPPPGTLSHPTRLVSYFRPLGKGRADFEVYAVDLPAGEPLQAYLTRLPIGADKWAWPAAAAPDAVGGVPAQRYTLTARTLRRDLVAVDRGGGRLVLFVATAAASDDKSLDQARQAVATVTWG